MKTVFSISLATGLLVSTMAFAEPIALSDRQMDNVTAGVGANNVATQPWPALTAAGFSLTHHATADVGIQHTSHAGVAVPRK